MVQDKLESRLLESKDFEYGSKDFENGSKDFEDESKSGEGA